MCIVFGVCNHRAAQDTIAVQLKQMRGDCTVNRASHAARITQHRSHSSDHSTQTAIKAPARTWNSSALTITRSPTVLVPAAIPWHVITIAAAWLVSRNGWGGWRLVGGTIRLAIEGAE